MNDPEGLLYFALDSSGSSRLGWLRPSDLSASVDSLDSWQSALAQLSDPPGLRLLSIRRCFYSEFRKLSALARS